MKKVFKFTLYMERLLESQLEPFQTQERILSLARLYDATKKRIGDNLSSSSPSQISMRYILEIHSKVQWSLAPTEKSRRAQKHNVPQCAATWWQHEGMTATWGEEAAEGES